MSGRSAHVRMVAPLVQPSQDLSEIGTTGAVTPSGIPMSSWEKKMHDKSKKIRKSLRFGFGKKDKQASPQTGNLGSQNKSATNLSSDASFDLPNIQPPNIPQGPQLKLFLGYGGGSKVWPHKWTWDPNLSLRNGDTVIFLEANLFANGDIHPSFRVDSHVIENTGSRFLIAKLLQGRLDDPLSSFEPSSSNQNLHGKQNQSYGEHVTIRLDFPTPENYPKAEIVRYHTATRNLFALLFDQPLVGVNIAQALLDLLERLKLWIPECDAATIIKIYIQAQGLDDMRSDPTRAISLLIWSENSEVRWVEGWKEAYVHCTGMYETVSKLPEYKQVTPVTQALLYTAHLRIATKQHRCQERFKDFDFSDMWSNYPEASPAKDAFLRLQGFFKDHYQSIDRAWPPEEGSWLTRFYAQKLQNDFGALYDYLVDRNATWEQEGDQWVIGHTHKRLFQSDPDGIPFSDIIISFDGQNNYPPIPCPYPLIPATSSARTSPRKGGLKNKTRDAFVEKSTDMAYLESTNTYLLGSNFEVNHLVTSFEEWERREKSTELTPAAARLGRWMLIYGILQTLAPLSVDVPDMLYTKDVHYHLCAKLKNCPPWDPDLLDGEIHENSYCWNAPKRWQAQHLSMSSAEFPSSFKSFSKLPSLPSPTTKGFHSTVRGSTTTTDTATSESSYDSGDTIPVNPIAGSMHSRSLRDRRTFDNLRSDPGNLQDVQDQMRNLQLENHTPKLWNEDIVPPPLRFPRRQTGSSSPVPQTPQTPTPQRLALYNLPAQQFGPAPTSRP
ncbi:hypothetical protein B7494_g3227 [Chlorociboria aeruginascens]|nr:hypothetical protein B7494_g3227 [Chlorociboria aeruginascens]